MLTVYGTQGSPGASATAMHLAAHWASTGREVLLIEADPAGGSLSHSLGIQFTPGSASFVASGLPMLSGHLIDHAQDVLFEGLHVMPAPASPSGAARVVGAFADAADDLRAISENEMAVIVDGGRITADTGASGLTTGAAGVVVVCRDSSQLQSLEPLRVGLAGGPDDHRPRGLAVTVGKSPLDDEEWLESYGLTFCGSVETIAGMAADLSAFLNRNKRKSKKWRVSLEKISEKLYPYAQPGPSESPRRLRSPASPPPGTEPAGTAEQTPSRSEAPSSSQDHSSNSDAPPTPEPQPAATQPHYLPPSGRLEGRGYGLGPPAVSQDPHGYGHPPPPSEPAPYPPPAVSQDPHGYGHPPPPSEPAPYPPPAYGQPHPQTRTHAHAPSQAQSPPVATGPPSADAEQPEPEPPAMPDIKPTGSFRDWAAKLHGSGANDDAVQNKGS